MKKYRFLLTVFAIFLLCASVAFVSCAGNGGETTTETPEGTEGPATDAPSSDDVTTEDITDDVTDAPEVTTEPPHVHAWTDWNAVKPATCTEAGTSERSCSCGEKETMNVDPVGHTGGEWITDIAATCTESGTRHQVCSVCNETLTTETVPAAGHTEGEWIVDKEATADSDGSKHQICAACGITIKTEIIASKPHTPGEWITDTEATCTESGSKHQVCSDCGVTLKTETVPAKGHTEVADAASAATCTENGRTAGTHCSVCNAVVIAPTVIPAKGHNEVVDAAKAATCTESGVTEGKHCTVCKAVTKAQQTVAATGHTNGEWITDKEPTYTAAGSRHLVCATCGATIKTETIPVLELEKTEYSVTLLDGFGNPISGIKVSFMSGNTVSAEATTNEQGIAVAKLVEGDYDAVTEAGSGFYSPSSVKLTASAPAAEIRIVGYATNPEYVYPDTQNGVYRVSVGSVRVPVEKGVIRYFFFAPSEGAVYHVYTDSDKVEVGYYGGSFFVTPTNTGNIDENGVLILEFLHSQVGNTMVLGLTSTSASVDECTLTIVRASDIEVSQEELPWDQYQLSKTPTKTEMPSGTLTYVPIEVNLSSMSGPVSEIMVVYSEKDGYYHLHTEDGPVLYARLAMATKYLDPIKTIASVTNIGHYFYDENGNFVKKESYVDAILAYCEVADSKFGVVPLDAELIYILKNAGEGGWYDKSSPDCIFEGVVVMPVNGWLFAVCYFE